MTITLPLKLDQHKATRTRGTHSVDDGLNVEIIRMLETDGRMPFSEIAQKLDVSEGTVRNRVNGLKEAGLLQIVAIADPSASEYKADAMICLKVASGVTPQVVAERLADIEAVVYILWVTGRFDLMVEIVCDESDGVAEFLDAHIHSRKDVAHSEVMLGLKNFKNQFLLKKHWESKS
ncbi:MAG: Lrp/AsnC family transcriptional regulator [Pseudomonadota bacterium]